MASKIFDLAVINGKCDFSIDHAYININGVCALKAKDKPGFGQNSDLYQTYEKLASMKVTELDADFKRLSTIQLKNVSHFVSSLYAKIDKSRKPSLFALLCIKVYNLFAAYFGKKKIEVYDYTNKSKILDISNRIKARLNSMATPAVSEKVVEVPPVVVPKKVAPVPVHEKAPEGKKKDNWAKVAKAPKINNLVKADPDAVPLVPEPVVSSYELNDLKNSGDYPALLDALKKNYLPEIQAELQRLREGDVLTPALEKTLNKQLNVVEKNKGFYGSDVTKFNKEGIRVGIGRTLEIKKFFKDRYYVLTHSQDTRWVVVTYLIKEMVRHMYTREQIHHFKFLRLPQDKPIPISRFTASGHVCDHDAATRRALLSSDAYLFNNGAAESCLYFLSNNSSIASGGGDSVVTNTAKEIIQQMYPHKHELAKKLHELVSKYVAEIGNNMPVGTLHVFCIPKEKAINCEYASVYRSHPFGVPCNCSHLKAMGDEKKIIELLQDDTELKCTYGLYPQYRIVAPNLKPEEVMIKSFTPLDKAKRHEIKQAMRNLINKY